VLDAERLTESPPSRDSVAELARRIAAKLHEMHLTEGDRVPTEAQLTREFASSRQRVREALRYLEALGLMQSRQGSGRTLSAAKDRDLASLLNDELPRSTRELLDLLEVRRVLEVGFLPTVISRSPALAEEGMTRALKRMQEAAATNSSLAHADRAFHQALFAPLSNTLLQQLLGRFWDMFAEVDVDRLGHIETAEVTIKHHEDILKAVATRDIMLAQFHMNAHFYDVAEVLSAVAAPRS
jgi:DNA-binding FadR family transcriptional regulator